MERGQAWAFDLMIAITLFTVGLVSFYLYSLNYNSNEQSPATTLEVEARAISDSILSPGIPESWSAPQVVTPGILTDNKINQSKLESLYNLIENDYNSFRALLKTNKEIEIGFSKNVTINGDEINSLGKSPENAENIIKIERLTIYQDSPITIYITLWE